MSNTKIIAHNTIYQLLGKIVTMSVTMISTALITRFYGAEGYGAVSLMIGFPALFYMVADFGLNAIATRELSIEDRDINNYLGNIVLIRLLLSVVLMICASFILLFLPYSHFVKFGVMVGLLSILTTCMIATANIGFQVKLRYDLSNIANSIGSLLFLIIVVVVLYLKVSIIFIVFGFVVNGLVNALFSFYFLTKLKIKPIFSYDTKIIKDLLLNSVPLGLMFVFSQINFKADSILLSFLPLPKFLNLNNIESVGIYTLPYKIFEVSLVIPTFFMNSVYPIMVKRYSVGKDQLFKIFRKSLVFLFLAGIFCGISGLVFSDWVIEIFGGREFSQSAFVLKTLLAFVFIFYLTQPLAWLIVTLKGQKYLPYIYLFAAIVNLVLNILFIPAYSFYASAFVTWISELVILILLGITARLLWVRA